MTSSMDRIRALGGDRVLGPVLIEHANRGIRIQLVVRALLALFVVLVGVLLPPAEGQAAFDAIAAAYVVWAVVAVAWARLGGITMVRYVWIALLVDLVILGALILVASRSDQQSWTADVLVNAFFLLPVLAAAQLRVWVCVAVGAPTVAIYLGSSLASQHANGEPLSSILLRTLVLAVLAAACVLLSRVQRSRVLTISRLVSDRDELIAELLTIEQRERGALAEQLHDGALQYVLAARQDLEELREETSQDAAVRAHAGRAVDSGAESFDRLEEALRESTRLLRSTVGQLHPLVLEHSGLAQAVREVAEAASARGGFSVEVETSDWAEGLRSSADAVLLRASRELLTNVVKHAEATAVEIRLSFLDGVARLTLSDNGRGLDSSALERRAAEGHIGIASLRARIEGAGGSLRIGSPNTAGSAASAGTSVAIDLPASLLASGANG